MSNSLIQFMKTYKISQDEKQLASFVKNKKVVLVGPSPFMSGKKLGHCINSYDVVVRVNQGIFLPSSNSEDFGDRTDIIYTSQRARDEYGLDFPPEFKSTKFIALLVQRKNNMFPDLKCYLCHNNIVEGEEYCLNADWKETTQKSIGHTTCIHPTRDYAKYEVPIVKRDLALYKLYYNSSLLSGMFALIDMICFGAKSVNIFGFDFYDSIKTMVKNNEEETHHSNIYCPEYKVFPDTMKMSHKDHDGKQLFLLKFLMNEFNNICIDSNLERILNERLSYTNISKHNNDYANYIKGKRVVIVGPSPILNEGHKGDYIDSFDIVVRLNLGESLTKCKSTDFGKRTDVVYINQSLRKDIGMETNILNYAMFVCVQSFASSCSQKCHNCSKTINKGDEIYIRENSSVSEKGFRTVTEISHWKCIAYTDYELCIEKIIIINSTLSYEYLKEVPLIGLSAIAHILKFEPKSVTILGFDFYRAVKQKTSIKAEDLYAKGYVSSDPLSLTMKDYYNKQRDLFTRLLKKHENLSIEY